MKHDLTSDVMKLSVKTDDSDEIDDSTSGETDSISDFMVYLLSREKALLGKDGIDLLSRGKTLLHKDGRSPQLEEEYSSESSTSTSEDDDLQAEWANLYMAEELVRKELTREIAIDSKTGEVVESPSKTFEPPPASYTLRVHCDSLKVSKSLDAVYVCDMSEHFYKCNTEICNLVQEYCQPLPFETLASLFVGMEGSTKLAKSNECPSYEHALPVRTLSMRIRPDAPCASVLDAVRVAVGSAYQHQGFLLKNQGGHLRAVVASQNASYLFDAQLCTARANAHERRLLLRFYHVDAAVTSELGISDDALPEGTLSDAKIPSVLHLKEASALIQLVRAKESWWRGTRDPLDSTFPSKVLVDGKVRNVASAHLQTTFRESKSVIKRLRCRSSNMPTAYPSLSPQDWPLIVASSALCSEVWWGLENTWSFGSLTTNPFGQAPYLPIVDIHYCSHFETMSKERLHPDFDKAMSEPDERVERAEDTNSLFMNVTKTMCETYKITPKELTDAIEVALPEPKSSSLSDLTREALKGLSEADPDNFLSIADNAVSAVYQAILDEHDNERHEQLKRRNVEVISRLLNLRHHTIETYWSLRNSFQHSEEVLELVKAAAEEEDKSTLPLRLDIVILVRIPISQGMCYVTASHIIFRTQSYFSIPQTLFFSLDNTKLQPSFSNSMGVFVENKKVFTFRPLMDVNRLEKFMSFLQLLQQFKAVED